MSKLVINAGISAMPQAPVRYDATNEAQFRNAVEQALKTLSSSSIAGLAATDLGTGTADATKFLDGSLTWRVLASADIPNPLVLGTDPTALVGTPVLRAGDDIAIGKASNPAFRLWNTTAVTGRRYALYSGTTGFVELYDDTAGAPVMTIDSAKKVTFYGTFNLQGATPVNIFLNDTGEAADNKKWRVYSNTGAKQIKWQTLNDAENSATDFFRITRSGAAPTLIEFPAVVPVRIGGSIFGYVGIKGDWNATDALGFENSGAGTYDTWRVGPGSGNGLNEFNWYNHTAAALRLRLKNDGTLIVNPAGSGVGAAVKLDVGGAIGAGGSVTISSSVNTNIGVTSNSSMFILRDSTNGGTALILIDNTGTKDIIVSQLGTTVFTTAAPTAAQIQIGVGAGNQLQVLGGSSRNGTTVRWTQIATQ